MFSDDIPARLLSDHLVSCETLARIWSTTPMVAARKVLEVSWAVIDNHGAWSGMMSDNHLQIARAILESDMEGFDQALQHAIRYTTIGRGYMPQAERLTVPEHLDDGRLHHALAMARRCRSFVRKGDAVALESLYRCAHWTAIAAKRRRHLLLKAGIRDTGLLGPEIKAAKQMAEWRRTHGSPL